MLFDKQKIKTFSIFQHHQFQCSTLKPHMYWPSLRKVISKILKYVSKYQLTTFLFEVSYIDSKKEKRITVSTNFVSHFVWLSHTWLSLQLEQNTGVRLLARVQTSSRCQRTDLLTFKFLNGLVPQISVFPSCFLRDAKIRWPTSQLHDQVAFKYETRNFYFCVDLKKIILLMAFSTIWADWMLFFWWIYYVITFGFWTKKKNQDWAIKYK